MSPSPLGGVWIGWECRKDVVGLWWKCGSSLIQMYVTVGRDRLCLILWHVSMPPIARGQTWLCQPLPVSTVPNTGRNIYDRVSWTRWRRRWGKTVPVAWSDEKLIILYCPGRGSNSRPSAHRGFKHGQGVPRPSLVGHGGGTDQCFMILYNIDNIHIYWYKIFLKPSTSWSNKVAENEEDHS